MVDVSVVFVDRRVVANGFCSCSCFRRNPQRPQRRPRLADQRRDLLRYAALLSNYDDDFMKVIINYDLFGDDAVVFSAR